ncbi:hypothetical protein FS827_18785 [Agrobacterium vitis]|uniref:M12 family metallopeptidase n=1 Tax=Allorhizobium ampelinum TaxID=3025782 RepID=UPI001F15CE8D|nr:M12 family metallopeptidase [Allorhizobium ampelinum]MCF1463358.1 hypothetical protein [Allorhizobium ampelinum]
MSMKYFISTLTCIVMSQSAGAATLPSADVDKDVPPIGDGVRDLGNDYVAVGDLVLRRQGVGTRAAVKRQWPGGRLIYEFDTSVTQTERDAFLAACATWANNTPVGCQQRNGEVDYALVRTHTGDGCGAVTSCSAVGRRGKVQPFNILKNDNRNDWLSPSAIQHELGHAFGLIHEHSRPDRDSYVFVREGNVAPEYRDDIIKKDVEAMTVSDYDYNSIMHYSNCGGSNSNDCNLSRRELWTLEPKPCGLDKVGGSTISVLDRDGLRKAYAAFLMTEIGTVRDAACGTLSYGTDIVPKDAVATTNFLKVETVSKEECAAFVPKDWAKGMCVPLKKTEMSLEEDTDPFSCWRDGFLTARQEATATCGCPVASFAAMCVKGNTATLKPYVTPGKGQDEWRLGRIRHFNDVMRGLQDATILKSDVAVSLPEFYFLNAADERLESKLFRMRYKIFSYASWRKTIDQYYQIDTREFAKFAHRAGLRTE